MFFSCIVPVYNIEEIYLKKCIETILNQTWTDFELIIVDDGSSCETGSFCDSYMDLDNRVRVVHQDNTGLAGARNTGMAHARGQWIIHIDGDDWIELGMLEQIYEVIKREPELDIVFWGYKMMVNAKFDEFLLKNKMIFNESYDRLKPQVLRSILSNDYIFRNLALNTTWGKAFRKEFLVSNNLTFDQKLRRAQDVPYSLNAFFAAKKVKYIDKALYNYRTDNISLSRGYNTKSYEWMTNTANACMDFAIEHKDIEGLYNCACAFVMRCFKIINNNDYMNNQNPKKMSIRKQEFISALNSEPYKSAIAIYDYSSLRMLDKIEAILIINKNFEVLRGYYLLRNAIRKLK